MNNKTIDIRSKLINREYALGRHSMNRIYEDGILTVNNLIRHLGRIGNVDRGYNQGGTCWTLDADYHGINYRLVVGLHKDNPNQVFIITLFKVLPEIKKGQNYRKYEGRTMTYSSEFTRAV